MEETTIKDAKAESTMPPRLSSFFKKWWVDNRERLAEWYRIYFHTIVVTLLLFINLWLGFSSILIFFSQWFGVDSGPVGFMMLFTQEPSGVLLDILEFLFVPLHHHLYWWIIVILNLPILTWLYSTTTQPIVKGRTTLISWTSKRGRIAAAIMSGISFMCSFIGIFAWYVRQYLFDFFAGIRSDKDYLVVTSMESFAYVLMTAPVFICLFALYFVAKEFYRNEDIRDMFFKWEFGLLARQSFSLRGATCDVIVGWEKDTHKPIVLSENSRFLHELIVGATGTGKTSTAILMRIVQDLIRIARGRRLGVVVLEPKGDLVKDVLKLCKELGIPDHKIKVVDPTDLVRSIKFNPFIGPLEAAAETFRGVLDALTGDQEEFFKGQQNETAALYTMLGKIRYGNWFNIIHLQQMYTDPRYLANMTEEVRRALDKELAAPDLSPEKKSLLERYNRIVSYFENEVLEYKTYKDKDGLPQPVLYPAGHKYEGQQVVENKKDKYVAGAKKYLNDIVMNALLSQLMVANDGEEVLDIDQFLQEGGVLLVNTALGELEELSLSFGQFFIRQFQSSVFRRPPNRIPIFFNIDEFPLYINEAFVRLLTLGRSYKVGTLISIQSLGQLKAVVPGYDNTIMNSARNKTVFGGGEYEDNERFSKHFGEEYVLEESLNESTTPISMPTQGWGYRYNTQRKLQLRFSPTDIKEQEFKHFIVDLVERDGSARPPVRAYGKFITETKFIKKFINIGKIELETKNHKPLAIAAHKLAHMQLLRPLFASSTDDLVQQKREVSSTITETMPEVEMLPTAPVGDQSPGTSSYLPEAVLSSDAGNTFSKAGDDSNLPLAETRSNLPTMNDDEMELPLEGPLHPVEEEGEDPIEYRHSPVVLTPEEEAGYRFFTENQTLYSGTVEYGGEHDFAKDDEESQNNRNGLGLPADMENSLDALFNKIGHNNEERRHKGELGFSETEEGEKGEEAGSGWTLADIVADDPVPTDDPSTPPRSEVEDTEQTMGEKKQDMDGDQEQHSGNSGNLGGPPPLDPDIFDLVAPDKRKGRQMQQEIARSNITPLSETQVDDD